MYFNDDVVIQSLGPPSMARPSMQPSIIISVPTISLHALICGPIGQCSAVCVNDGRILKSVKRQDRIWSIFPQNIDALHF